MDFSDTTTEARLKLGELEVVSEGSQDCILCSQRDSDPAVITVTEWM